MAPHVVATGATAQRGPLPLPLMQAVAVAVVAARRGNARVQELESRCKALETQCRSSDDVLGQALRAIGQSADGVPAEAGDPEEHAAGRPDQTASLARWQAASAILSHTSRRVLAQVQCYVMVKEARRADSSALGPAAALLERTPVAALLEVLEDAVSSAMETEDKARQECQASDTRTRASASQACTECLAELVGLHARDAEPRPSAMVADDWPCLLAFVHWLLASDGEAPQALAQRLTASSGILVLLALSAAAEQLAGGVGCIVQEASAGSQPATDAQQARCLRLCTELTRLVTTLLPAAWQGAAGWSAAEGQLAGAVQHILQAARVCQLVALTRPQLASAVQQVNFGLVQALQTD